MFTLGQDCTTELQLFSAANATIFNLDSSGIPSVRFISNSGGCVNVYVTDPTLFTSAP
jgi:hypothetical protein